MPIASINLLAPGAPMNAQGDNYQSSTHRINSQRSPVLIASLAAITPIYLPEGISSYAGDFLASSTRLPKEPKNILFRDQQDEADSNEIESENEDEDELEGDEELDQDEDEDEDYQEEELNQDEEEDEDEIDTEIDEDEDEYDEDEDEDEFSLDEDEYDDDEDDA